MNERPKTLEEVADQSDAITDFGQHLRDWLHELRRFSSREQAVVCAPAARRKPLRKSAR
jgi:hypothetical protein